ncbi:hypothetical protein D7W81_18570 [Corallococcus aberystwythensis]|uniref:Uncharacterized protein n=1 Tax=Corallococcus aberystwythensis TaxID=2316722 RepID=A0A3A8QBR8_9BACT|nr:hypothetical protein D7W81_18570 [Corallococcus aberystwythensis]
MLANIHDGPPIELHRWSADQGLQCVETWPGTSREMRLSFALESVTAVNVHDTHELLPLVDSVPAVGMPSGRYRASRTGDFTTADSTLRKLLGRAPTDMREAISRPR